MRCAGTCDGDDAKGERSVNVANFCSKLLRCERCVCARAWTVPDLCACAPRLFFVPRRPFALAQLLEATAAAAAAAAAAANVHVHVRPCAAGRRLRARTRLGLYLYDTEGVALRTAVRPNPSSEKPQLGARLHTSK